MTYKNFKRYIAKLNPSDLRAAIRSIFQKKETSFSRIQKHLPVFVLNTLTSIIHFAQMANHWLAGTQLSLVNKLLDRSFVLRKLVQVYCWPSTGLHQEPTHRLLVGSIVHWQFYDFTKSFSFITSQHSI